MRVWWAHSYSARQSQPMRRMSISRSRAGRVFLFNVWLPNTLKSLDSSGWFTIGVGKLMAPQRLERSETLALIVGQILLGYGQDTGLRKALRVYAAAK